MSSSRTTLTSTTGSSGSFRSRRDGGARAVAVIACGALGGHIREIAERRGWSVAVRCLPAGLHNSPRSIGPAAERLASELIGDGWQVALAYADCGTYGELDALCERLGLARLPGLHCYDVLAGPDRMRALFEAEPGTYVLTDFLVRSFQRSVIEPLGLDRHPELWADYFGHYRRVVWLAQSPEPGLADPGLADPGLAEPGLAEPGLADPGLAERARAVAELFGLPLTTIEVGVGRLEAALESLVAP